MWDLAVTVLASTASAARASHALLALPGMRMGLAPAAGLLLPPALLWLAGGSWLALAPPSQRLDLLLGSSWEVCSANVALLSLPTLASMLWFLRGMAPESPGGLGIFYDRPPRGLIEALSACLGDDAPGAQGGGE